MKNNKSKIREERYEFERKTADRLCEYAHGVAHLDCSWTGWKLGLKHIEIANKLYQKLK